MNTSPSVLYTCQTFVILLYLRYSAMHEFLNLLTDTLELAVLLTSQLPVTTQVLIHVIGIIIATHTLYWLMLLDLQSPFFSIHILMEHTHKLVWLYKCKTPKNNKW